jgi:hypothetical protein
MIIKKPKFCILFLGFKKKPNLLSYDRIMRKLREAKDAPKCLCSSYLKTWSGFDDAKKRQVKEYWLSELP